MKQWRASAFRFQGVGTSLFLDPTNALFTDVQGRFLKKQTELYGTDHLYAADPFNEITPPSWEPNQRQRLPAAHRGRMGICLPCARWWNPYYLSLVFYSTVLDYFLVTLMERCPREGANVDVVSRLIRLRFDDPVLKRAFLGAPWPPSASSGWPCSGRPRCGPP